MDWAGIALLENFCYLLLGWAGEWDDMFAWFAILSPLTILNAVQSTVWMVYQIRPWFSRDICQNIRPIPKQLGPLSLANCTLDRNVNHVMHYLNFRHAIICLKTCYELGWQTKRSGPWLYLFIVFCGLEVLQCITYSVLSLIWNASLWVDLDTNITTIQT